MIYEIKCSKSDIKPSELFAFAFFVQTSEYDKIAEFKIRHNVDFNVTSNGVRQILTIKESEPWRL